MTPKKIDAIKLIIRTTPVCLIVCSRLGQLTFLNSPRTSVRNPLIRLNILSPIRHTGLQILAGQEGLEPTTRGFGDRCSTNWSYWPIWSPYARCASGRTGNTSEAPFSEAWLSYCEFCCSFFVCTRCIEAERCLSSCSKETYGAQEQN